MAKKSNSEQAKKENGASIKSLLPGLLFGTVIVVLVSVIGRKATEK